MIIDLEDVGIQTPSLVQKADGSSIYATRDIAAALFRRDTWHFDRCVYVVGADQILHFKQLFAVMEKLDPGTGGACCTRPSAWFHCPRARCPPARAT